MTRLQQLSLLVLLVISMVLMGLGRLPEILETVAGNSDSLLLSKAKSGGFFAGAWIGITVFALMQKVEKVNSRFWLQCIASLLMAGLIITFAK